MSSSPPAHPFAYLGRFEHCLQSLFESLNRDSSSSPHLCNLADSMAYSTLGGGKRLRAMLVYLGANCCLLDKSGPPGHKGINPALPEAELRPGIKKWDGVDAAAVAIELIHCYSLVHDDLPAMDDDDLRRGKPTCHKAFDEATAILAGDALQAQAFSVLTKFGHDLQPQQRLDLIDQLAIAAGSGGMVGGQAIDLALTNRPASYDELVQMHNLKTGALISAAVVMGGICANADAKQLTSLRAFGQAMGLAFQIRDDLLDEEGDTERIGKQAGMDTAANKTTFPALIGAEAARNEAAELKNRAFGALKDFGAGAEELRALATFSIERDR